MKNVFLLSMMILLTACFHETEAPDNLLTKEQMALFLIDMHVAEAKINNLNLKKDSAQKLSMQYEAYLYEKHQISDSVYKKSYHYYLTHLREFEEVYDIVVDSLSLMERLNTPKK